MLAHMSAIHVHDLSTPALVVDGATFEHNLQTMAAARPGPSLRAHVKAHKTTEIARRQVALGHTLCAATPREIIGLAHAGVGNDDLLLANETVDAARLAAMAALDANVTVAVDSDATIDAAAAAGIRAVLIDLFVGLPRCGCPPADAPRLADRARAAGLFVRGVMGYEGHVVGVEDRAARVEQEAAVIDILRTAHAAVGGDIVSGGGTGTYDLNAACTEIQAGSYILMDHLYDQLGLPFRPAFWVETTVVSVHPDGWAVCDAGLKSLAMDHGNPTTDSGDVLFCSDEHVVFVPASPIAVGDRVRVWPVHVDPTIALHERMHVVDADGAVVDTWAVDLRGW
jgi:D-serine deaminase-like pyridoxal phosphate-dependent protein